MDVKKAVDQAVRSEVLMTMAEPVKRVDIIGPIKLWNLGASVGFGHSEKGAWTIQDSWWS